MGAVAPKKVVPFTFHDAITLLTIYRVAPKMYTLLQQFGGFESVWTPIVATSNTYIESKIQ